MISSFVKTKIFFTVLLVSLFLAPGCRETVLGPDGTHVPDKKGFSYTSFASNAFTAGGPMMQDLKRQTQNSWIALVVFEYQRDPSSSSIAPNTDGVNPLNGGPWPTTSTLDDLREGIRQARALSLRIMLKPHVDLYTGEWRATIRPDDGGTWFAAYETMILKYAALAQELDVELLCIGSEFVVATQPRFTTQWRALISSVRTIYKGQLIYAANWSGAAAYGVSQAEFSQVGFWSSLDYIGVDSYFPLTESTADTIPPFDAAVSRLRAQGGPIGSLSRLYSKPVVITETGAQSVRGALAAPWDFSLGSSAGAVPDTNAQDFYYRAMIVAMGNAPWCDGIFWWNWESIPTSAERTNYTPRNKRAAATLRMWYVSDAI